MRAVLSFLILLALPHSVQAESTHKLEQAPTNASRLSVPEVLKDSVREVPVYSDAEKSETCLYLFDGRCFASLEVLAKYLASQIRTCRNDDSLTIKKLGSEGKAGQFEYEGKPYTEADLCAYLIEEYYLFCKNSPKVPESLLPTLQKRVQDSGSAQQPIPDHGQVTRVIPEEGTYEPTSLGQLQKAQASDLRIVQGSPTHVLRSLGVAEGKFGIKMLPELRIRAIADRYRLGEEDTIAALIEPKALKKLFTTGKLALPILQDNNNLNRTFRAARACVSNAQGDCVREIEPSQLFTHPLPEKEGEISLFNELFWGETAPKLEEGQTIKVFFELVSRGSTWWHPIKEAVHPGEHPDLMEAGAKMWELYKEKFADHPDASAADAAVKCQIIDCDQNALAITQRYNEIIKKGYEYGSKDKRAYVAFGNRVAGKSVDISTSNHAWNVVVGRNELHDLDVSDLTPRSKPRLDKIFNSGTTKHLEEGLKKVKRLEDFSIAALAKPLPKTFSAPSSEKALIEKILATHPEVLERLFPSTEFAPIPEANYKSDSSPEAVYFFRNRESGYVIQAHLKTEAVNLGRPGEIVWNERLEHPPGLIPAADILYENFHAKGWKGIGVAPDTRTENSISEITGLREVGRNYFWPLLSLETQTKLIPSFMDSFPGPGRDAVMQQFQAGKTRVTGGAGGIDQIIYNKVEGTFYQPGHYSAHSYSVNPPKADLIRFWKSKGYEAPPLVGYEVDLFFHAK